MMSAGFRYISIAVGCVAVAKVCEGIRKVSFGEKGP